MSNSQVYLKSDRVDGLNSQTAPHLLPAGGLQQAVNVDFSERGASGSAADDLLLETAGGTVSGIGCAEVDGDDYYIYKELDDEELPYSYPVKAYKVSTGVTSTVSEDGWSSGELQVIQGDDVAILTDGSKNVFWDGTVEYKFGAPEMSRSSVSNYVFTQPVAGVAITAISVDGSGVVTVTASGHGLADGDKTYIAGMADGYTEINSKVYDVTNVDGDDFDLDGVDGSDWTAGTPDYTDAKSYKGACGLTEGTYTYRVGSKITLPSGEIIRGSLAAVRWFATTDNYEISISPTDIVSVYLRGFAISDVTDWIAGSYTLGADLLFEAELYRSKFGDTDQAYRVESFEHDDIYNTSDTYDEYTADGGVGAQWLPSSFDAHDAPDTFSTAATHAYRLYVAVGNEFYWSGTDGHSYFSPTDTLSVDDKITALVSVGDFLAIFSRTGAWIYDPASVTLKDLKVRFGVYDFHGVEKFDGRVWFANSIGLFMLDTVQFGAFAVDAVQSVPVSGVIDDEWQASDGTWSLASTHDTLYCNNYDSGSSTTFVLHIGDGNKWSEEDPGRVVLHGMASDKANNRVLYQSAAGAIYAVREGSGQKTATLETRLYPLERRGQAHELKLDIGSSAEWSASVEFNTGDTGTASFSGEAGRTVQYSVLGRPAGEFVSVVLTGTGKLYGWSLAVTLLAGRGH